MARHTWDPKARQVTVVRPRRVGEGLTPDQARGPRWRWTSSGLYVPASVDPSLAQQRVVECAARLPPGGAVTGWAACLLSGAAWFDGLDSDGVTQLPVQLAVGPRGGVRRDAGVVVSFARLPEWEVRRRYGVRCARPERAVLDEMRRRSREEAVVVAESALAAEITSPRRLLAFLAGHRSARGRGLARWALLRARGGVRSPLEVRVRTVAEEVAGYSRLEVNRVVHAADGTRIGEVDLLDVESETVIETDGAAHRDAGQQAWDIVKEEALRGAGIEVARVTGSQSRDPDGLARRLVAVRARSRFTPEADRSWRLGPARRRGGTRGAGVQRDVDVAVRVSGQPEQSRGGSCWEPPRLFGSAPTGWLDGPMFKPGHDQSAHRVRMEWGPTGASAVVADVTVVIDVLSFTTTVSIAVERGITVLPFVWRDERAREYAAARDAVLAVGRLEALEHTGGVSLSPAAMARVDGVERIVLPSPNGSTICFALADTGATVVAASLRNASAVATEVAGLLREGVTCAVIAAGERWPGGSLRPAVEDLWGAGAVIAGLADLGIEGLSPEARVAEHAFRAVRPELAAELAACASGGELAAAGFADDVQVAAQLDVSRAVPVLRGEAFVLV